MTADGICSPFEERLAWPLPERPMQPQVIARLPTEEELGRHSARSAELERWLWTIMPHTVPRSVHRYRDDSYDARLLREERLAEVVPHG